MVDCGETEVLIRFKDGSGACGSGNSVALVSRGTSKSSDSFMGDGGVDVIDIITDLVDV